MKLPTISLPKYRLQIPSTKQDITFRPFLVKEQKALLMSLESENTAEILEAIKDTIRSCTAEAINVEILPLFDLCYIFINIRAKSVGEVAEPRLSCESCKTSNQVPINLTDIKVQFPPEHKNKIDLDNDSGVVMQYPTIAMTAVLREVINSESNDNIPLIASCIEKIYVGENVFTGSDYSLDERKSFLENLSGEQLNKILEFFETMPVLSHIVNFDCVKCKHKNTVTLEGLRDFFL